MRKVPVPEETASEGYAPPEGVTEELLAELWCRLLKREHVGRHDNFFDLGGHSLLLVRVHRRLRETLKRELTMVELFQYPTIGALARYLSPAADERPASQASL
jgi:aryl carrier-like protein